MLSNLAELVERVLAAEDVTSDLSELLLELSDELVSTDVVKEAAVS